MYALCPTKPRDKATIKSKEEILNKGNLQLCMMTKVIHPLNIQG